MKILKWFGIALIVSLLIIGCSKNPTDGQLKEYHLTGSFFPMHVGDQWMYQQGSMISAINITGNQIIGNHDYFVFVETRDDQPDYSRTSYYRMDDMDKVCINVDGIDALFVDFAQMEGELLTGFANHDIQILGRDVPITTPAGVFYDCIEVYFDIPDVADEERIHTYSPGIGLIDISNYHDNSRLISATINGETY